MFIDKIQTRTVTASDGRTVHVRFEINPRARRLILRIDETRREAVAVAPSRGLISDAAAFAADRADWIADRLDALPTVLPLIDGAEIPIRGRAHRITSAGHGRLVRLTEDPPTLSAPGAPETFPDRVRRFLRRAAKADLGEAVDRHCGMLGVAARRIVVTDTRSRWGSCTSDGRLAFNWRLICAPPFVLDYVAAHECAHLLEMNHSARFWAHVAACVGDPKAGRRWLRANGAALHAVGAARASAAA